MPRYLVERIFSVDENDMPRIGRRSNQVKEEHFPEIVWEHSHVVVDEAGTVKTYCVYSAPDVDTVTRHAAELGEHNVSWIQEIAGDVTPADFPL
jgi:hypothetical protein